MSDKEENRQENDGLLKLREEALAARCSNCRFFKRKSSHCTLNDFRTKAMYKCSDWKFKGDKELEDECKSHNHEVAKLRAENERLRVALIPVLEVDCQLDNYPTKEAYMAALEIVVSDAQRIYNEGGESEVE